jgi:hypothetical protein
MPNNCIFAYAPPSSETLLAKRRRKKAFGHSGDEEVFSFLNFQDVWVASYTGVTYIVSIQSLRHRRHISKTFRAFPTSVCLAIIKPPLRHEFGAFRYSLYHVATVFVFDT